MAELGLVADDAERNPLAPTALEEMANAVEQPRLGDATTIDMALQALPGLLAGRPAPDRVADFLFRADEALGNQAARHGGQGGAIVNLSSAAAKLGSPNQYVDYAASKGAIDTLTLGLAKEVAAEGIRVNGVRPGIIDTDIHASGGLPDRVKELAGGTSAEVVVVQVLVLVPVLLLLLLVEQFVVVSVRPDWQTS